MSLTVEQLKKTTSIGPEAERVIKEQLLLIDEQLKRHEATWGRNVLAVDLQSNFGLEGINPTSQQVIVYDAIIRNLEGRGFEVKLYLPEEKDSQRLLIRWMTTLDEAKYRIMENNITKHLLSNKKDAKAFLDGLKET